jgi:hypothetical protein
MRNLYEERGRRASRHGVRVASGIGLLKIGLGLRQGGLTKDGYVGDRLVLLLFRVSVKKASLMTYIDGPGLAKIGRTFMASDETVSSASRLVEIYREGIKGRKTSSADR